MEPSPPDRTGRNEGFRAIMKSFFGFIASLRNQKMAKLGCDPEASGAKFAGKRITQDEFVLKRVQIKDHEAKFN